MRKAMKLKSRKHSIRLLSGRKKQMGKGRGAPQLPLLRPPKGLPERDHPPQGTARPQVWSKDKGTHGLRFSLNHRRVWRTTRPML